MKYCPNCGAEVKDSAKFCQKCGSSMKSNLVSNANQNDQKANGSSNNVLIIAVAAVIIVAIIAGTFVFLSGDDSGSDVVVVNNTDSDDAVEDSSDAKSSSSSSSSSSNSDVVTYSEAQSMYPSASSNVISNAFDEADSNDDGVLTGSEISEFKRLAKLAINTASEADSTTYNEHGSITRYCTTHGRVTTGEDLQCPYCQAEGLDSRTVKGSTEYN